MSSRRVVPRFGFVAPLAAVVACGLALAPPRAAAELAVSPPVALDPAKIRAVRMQESVVAAPGDDATLFAWVDARSGNRDIYTTRVRPDGVVLDPNGIAIAVTGAEEFAPAVSWNGTNWLVVWSTPTQGIRAARVAEDGEVLDPAGFTIAAAATNPLSPVATRLGNEHLVVWVTTVAGSRLWGSVVGSDATVLGPESLAAGAANTTQPAVAVNEPTAYVAFHSDVPGAPGIYGFRLERDGVGPALFTRLDATDVPISTGTDRKANPAVGARVDGWLVAWEDARNSATSGVDVFASTVDAVGAVQEPAGIEVSDDAGDERDIAVTHNEARWLVAWSQQDVGQFLRAVTNNGNPSGGRVDVSTASGTLGQAAFGGDIETPILAWSAPEAGTSAPKPPQDILGVILGAGHTPGPEFPISTQTPNQTQPALAFGANRWFMAWVDDRYGPTEGRLRYALTDSARFEAPDLISFVAVRPGLDQQQPTACFDGTNFNLFWTEERGGHRAVLGARFTAGGAPIDTFVVASGAWNHVDPTCQHVTSGLVMVAWTDERIPGDRDIWGIRVIAGAITGVETVLADANGVQEERPHFPARIVDPGLKSTLFVYQKRTTPGTGSIATRSLFFESDPFFVGGETVVREEAERSFEAPRVAWNGDSWIVTYQEFVENDGTGLYVPWATFLDGGAFCFDCGDAQLGPGSYVPANPVATTTGYNFLTLWSHRDGGQVDLNLRRTGVVNFDFPDPAPIKYTDDLPTDVPGAALKGQSDRVGFAYLRSQNDGEWQGLRLFGADARDTLTGAVLINEFSAHPPSDRDEFYELFNTAGQDFQLKGWFITIDDDSANVIDCFSKLRTPPVDPESAKRGDSPELLGTPCGVIRDQEYFTDSFFEGLPESGTEGFLPDRGAVIELFSPGGVLVDAVGYGFRGGAPVMPALPAAIAPVARVPGNELLAPGDSVEVSTARLPNGEDTGNDANDFNSTTSPTAGQTNVGAAAQLGSSLFTTRLFWNPPAGSVDALELFNPTNAPIDFTDWYLGSNDGTQLIGVAGSLWSVLERSQKRVLRRGEPGAFTTDLDYLTVVYLYTPDFVRVEQLGWSRADNQQPQQCMNREPETGGFHDGFDWFTSGGQDNLFAGELRYANCNISSPDVVVDAPGTTVPLSFRGAVPNPTTGGGALVFSVPGVRAAGGADGATVPVRLRLVDVAGRVRATLVDGGLAPGEHRVPLAGAIGGRGSLAAGVYYADLEVGGQRLTRPVVIVP